MGASEDRGCLNCGFALYLPVAETSFAQVGLYSDSRFPGRVIVSLKEHYSYLEEVPSELLHQFMLYNQKVIEAIKQVTGSERVNFAILGNAVPHVHAHLIPRFPRGEEKPDKAPWEDPRVKGPLQGIDEVRLISQLSSRIDR